MRKYDNNRPVLFMYIFYENSLFKLCEQFTGKCPRSFQHCRDKIDDYVCP